MNEIEKSLLGKATTYHSFYNPSLLYPILRKNQRESIGIYDPLPFNGSDIWNAFEISWLNSKGKPEIAFGEFWVPCQSLYLFESKSLKLYLNSLNGSSFTSLNDVASIIKQDLSNCIEYPVTVKLTPFADISFDFDCFDGICLDDLDITIDQYEVNPNLLKYEDQTVTESLYTHLFKSNCLATGQPDWATIWIKYSGTKICRNSLLAYLVSYRNHQAFHEHCIERIFKDLLSKCSELTVYGRFTRRGGIDLNPFRSTSFSYIPKNMRTLRQ